MCCSRKQQQHILPSGQLVQTRQVAYCGARRQQRREVKAVTVNGLSTLPTDLIPQPANQNPHWTAYQPRTMAGILVMGVALGLQEGGKKIKEKRDERKAKKAALAAEAHMPAESSSSGAMRGRSSSKEVRRESKGDEARSEQKRHSFSSERAREEDAPPSYDEVARPTYEEATRYGPHRV